MKLSKDLAEVLLYGGTEEGYKFADDVLMSSGRWTERRLLVIADSENNLFAADYEVGLTEMQDTEPFEYQTEVEFYPVEKKEKITYDYRRLS